MLFITKKCNVSFSRLFFCFYKYICFWIVFFFIVNTLPKDWRQESNHQPPPKST